MSANATKSGLEVEVKLRIRSSKAVRKKLTALGCVETVPRSFEENWTWDFGDQRLRRKGQLLRLRRFGGQCSLTFKGSPIRSRHFKVREEFETEVGDMRVLAQILEKVGLQIVFRYEKFRTSYFRKTPGTREQITVTIDETPIGNYLEMEGSQRGISHLARALGYAAEDFIKESYGALFENSELRKQQRDMVFPKRLRRD